MHKLVIFSSVYLISFLITLVNTYVLFAANLDDFKSIAKKIVPDELAEQLADMAQQKSMKSHYDDSRTPVILTPEVGDEELDVNEYDEVKKTRFDIKNHGVDIDDIVEKVKVRLEKDFEKKHNELRTVKTDSIKNLAQPKPGGRNGQLKHEKRQPRHENYQNAQPKYEKYEKQRPRHEKFETQQQGYEDYDRQQSRYEEKQHKKYSGYQNQQPKRNDDYENQQPKYEANQNEQAVYEYQQQKHKVNVNQRPKEYDNDYEERQPKRGVHKENQQQKHENQQETEDYEEKQPKFEGKQLKQDHQNQRPKHDEQSQDEAYQNEEPNHEFYGKEQPKHDDNQNEQPKIKEKKLKIPNYDEKSDNIKDYSNDQDTNTEMFREVSLIKHDSYEEYVIPKKDDPYDSADTNVKSNLKVKAEDNKNTQFTNREDENPNIQINKENVKEVQNDDVHARTENMFYEDMATEHTNRAVKNTMIPTKRYFKFSSPNYYVKLSTHPDKYDFNEPLPEKDRQKEDLKHFPNPPAHINGKVALKI